LAWLTQAESEKGREGEKVRGREGGRATYLVGALPWLAQAEGEEGRKGGREGGREGDVPRLVAAVAGAGRE